MTNIPSNLLYTKDDEWLQIDGDVATIGITDYAQDQLSDIVYLELPAADDEFEAEDVFGIVESVKAASDLLMPVGGTVAEANEALVDEPESLNDDPYGDGWMIKVKMSDSSDLDGLMDAAAYATYCEERG